MKSRSTVRQNTIRPTCLWSVWCPPKARGYSGQTHSVSLLSLHLFPSNNKIGYHMWMTQTHVLLNLYTANFHFIITRLDKKLSCCWEAAQKCLSLKPWNIA